MPTNVNEAFAEFLADAVNLHPTETDTARGSRDWLATQLRGLHLWHPDFPRSYEEKDVYFGSFHRRTKIRPLDDIDLISCISAEGSTYTTFGSEVRIHVHPTAERLLELCHDGTNELNSRKVINRFVKSLEGIPQYRRADVGRNGEAAVLALESYPWSFDIVPAMFTKPEYSGRDYYLIPDGQGNWKKTDPRIDQERVTRVNLGHGGNVLAVIRLLKYWNRRTTKPVIGSYLFESMVLTHYETVASTASNYVDLEVAPVLSSIAVAVFSSVPDPKGIQGDLNQLGFEDRLAISRRAAEDANKAMRARAAESQGDHRTSIGLWREVFGPDFPAYG